MYQDYDSTISRLDYNPEFTMIFQATVDIGGATSNFGVTTSDFRVSKAMI